MPVSSFIGCTLMEVFMTIDDKFINIQVLLFIHQRLRPRRVEKKKLLGRHKEVAKWLFNYFKKIQKQPPEVFYKKAVPLKS